MIIFTVVDIIDAVVTLS